VQLLTPLQANFDLARATLFLAGLRYSQNIPEARLTWQDAARRIIRGGYAFLLEQERTQTFPLVAAYLNDPDPDLAALSATLLAQIEQVPPLPLRIHLLGEFQVWQGKRRIEKQELRRRRSGELLVLLLMAPGYSLSAEQIAEALSPEKSPEAAPTVVHHATSELRRILEPELPDRRFVSRYLEVTDRLISLRLPPGSWLDIEAFEQAVSKNDWEQALALYAGEFLPEYRYAEWAAAAREQLAEHYRAVLLVMAQDRLEKEDWLAALEFARRLIALDPWHEEAVLVAMRACQGLNDLSGARRHFKRLEKTLWDELGVQPQEELQSFYRSLDNRRRK
jgi:DNA-binding SARP family transcriptional activator